MGWPRRTGRCGGSRSRGSATRRRPAWCRSSRRRSSTTWRRGIRPLGRVRRPGTRRARRPARACRSVDGWGRGAGRRRARCSGRENAVPVGRGLCGGADGWRRPGGGAGGRESVRRRHRRGRAAGGGVPGRARGRPVRTAEVVAAMEEPPDPFKVQPGNTTLVCLMTDRDADKAECARVARAAAAGLSRAVEPVFTDVDGDVVFCLASGEGEAADRFDVLQAQTVAARVAADAIRDAVTQCRGTSRERLTREGRSPACRPRWRMRVCRDRSRRRRWCSGRSATGRRIGCCTCTRRRAAGSGRSRRGRGSRARGSAGGSSRSSGST